ncbi:MAG: DUF2283 domain-containing protein [Candidatus Woesearchaeota archaeon]|nr:DUF2283 domain-containing protein [Candidatus Woesearchaeota archaeon]
MEHLDARGKGEVDYDYKEDTLFFKIKNREYKKSLDYGNFVLDIDKEGFITGIQLFDASKLFKIDKNALLKVKRWEFNTKVENKIITVQLTFETVKRNKVIVEKGHNLERETTARLQDSETMCTIQA